MVHNTDRWIRRFSTEKIRIVFIRELYWQKDGLLYVNEKPRKS